MFNFIFSVTETQQHICDFQMALAKHLNAKLQFNLSVDPIQSKP